MKIKFKNEFYLMRHGECLSNIDMKISSDAKTSLSGNGLTEKGKKQAGESAKRSKLDSNIIIFSSDFKRTRETAEELQKITGTKDLYLTELLRERNFGEWEGTSSENYSKIWKLDADNAENHYNGVESPRNVLMRTLKLVEDIEKKYSKKKIVLVSHGDVLQILETFFMQLDPSMHRSLKHLENAEIRKIT